MHSKSLLLLASILPLVSCKKPSVPTGTEVAALPSVAPTKYTHPRYQQNIPRKFAIAKAINAKYGAGPRLRFDEYLDGIAEQYFPCWDNGDTGLIDPQAGICQGSPSAEASRYCEASTTNASQADVICRYPEDHSAEKEAIRETVTAAREVSELARANGFSFDIHPLELYMVILGEAGFRPLSNNTFTQIDGYQNLGVDNLSESLSKPIRDKYLKWSTPEFQRWMKESAQVIGNDNELGEATFTPTNFDIKNGMKAVATEYAYFKSVAHRRFSAATGKPLTALPRRGQLYWSYAHFNAGEAVPWKFRMSRHDEPNTREDSYGANMMSASFNATVRVATYVYWVKLCQQGLGVAQELCAGATE